MDEAIWTVRQDLEFYQEMLLERFSHLRQQPNASHSKLEEERIELALSRIGWGNYRTCMECGHDIGDKILMADPTTMTCPSCASR